MGGRVEGGAGCCACGGRGGEAMAAGERPAGGRPGRQAVAQCAARACRRGAKAGGSPAAGASHRWLLSASSGSSLRVGWAGAEGGVRARGEGAGGAGAGVQRSRSAPHNICCAGDLLPIPTSHPATHPPTHPPTGPARCPGPLQAPPPAPPALPPAPRTRARAWRRWRRCGRKARAGQGAGQVYVKGQHVAPGQRRRAGDPAKLPAPLPCPAPPPSLVAAVKLLVQRVAHHGLRLRSRGHRRQGVGATRRPGGNCGERRRRRRHTPAPGGTLAPAARTPAARLPQTLYASKAPNWAGWRTLVCSRDRAELLSPRRRQLPAPMIAAGSVEGARVAPSAVETLWKTWSARMLPGERWTGCWPQCRCRAGDQAAVDCCQQCGTAAPGCSKTCRPGHLRWACGERQPRLQYSRRTHRFG